MTNTYHYIDYWFIVTSEDSDCYGEEFFVEVLDNEEAHDMAWDIATENFPNEELKCYGRVSDTFAEMMGFDTY